MFADYLKKKNQSFMFASVYGANNPFVFLFP